MVYVWFAECKLGQEQLLQPRLINRIAKLADVVDFFYNHSYPINSFMNESSIDFAASQCAE